MLTSSFLMMFFALVALGAQDLASDVASPAAGDSPRDMASHDLMAGVTYESCPDKCNVEYEGCAVPCKQYDDAEEYAECVKDCGDKKAECNSDCVGCMENCVRKKAACEGQCGDDCGDSCEAIYQECAKESCEIDRD